MTWQAIIIMLLHEGGGREGDGGTLNGKKTKLSYLLCLIFLTYQ